VSKQGLIQIRDVGRLERATADRPRLGLGVAKQLGLSEAERDRIGEEIGEGDLILSKATRAQLVLLQRLAAAAPERCLRFPFIATVRRFLAATASLDDAAASALSDDALAQLWRDADERSK
jgi:hypothetical protein